MPALPPSEITVSLSPNEIVVHGGEVRVTAAPIVHLGPRKRQFFGGTRRELVGVSGSIPANGPDLSLHLFARQEWPVEERKHASLYFALFMRRLVADIILHYKLRVKPRARVGGLPTVAATLGSDPESVVRAVLMEAGASEVEFQ